METLGRLLGSLLWEFRGLTWLSLLQYPWASLVAQVKNPPAMLETGLQSLVGKIPWRREWLPTPVFWPGEFHGRYSPGGCKESDTTEQLSFHFTSCDSVLLLFQASQIWFAWFYLEIHPWSPNRNMILPTFLAFSNTISVSYLKR